MLVKEDIIVAPMSQSSKPCFAWVIFLLSCTGAAFPQRQMEALDRGLVAVPQKNGEVFISWRLHGTDPGNIAFHVWRDDYRLTETPLAGATCFVDTSATPDARYAVQPVIDGAKGKRSTPVTVWQQAYLSVPLQTPDGYQPNDASVGDLDGDGQYELVLHQVGRGRDNSRRGPTTAPIFEAYEPDGTQLWRIHLGTNIREGAHYTQFMVYDLDGDGKAEFACKTADGTVDGQGTVIGDPNADWVNDEGLILNGPEYLTIFEGTTGKALATERYVPRRHPTAGDNPTNEQMVEVWGDNYGNRMDRFLACVAYLDGKRPSLVMCRGYYTGRNPDTGRTVLAAWHWRDNQLSQVWTFDTYNTDTYRDYRGQGNHSVAVADVDHDGKDEIIYGACVIDHNGTGLYTKKLGHGDAQHTSDLDPARPGLETWSIHENPRHPYGAELCDARTGEILWGLDIGDTGRGLAIDIDPRYPGHECWTNNSGGLYNIKGEKISDSMPASCNMAVWWDGDLLRELLNRTSISKWDWQTHTTQTLLTAEGCASNNGSKATPCLVGDLFGDWREEVIWRTRDGKELRVFTTTIPTTHRIYTLMHDPVYRLSVAWQNVGYNQPGHTGFYLGEGMAAPPRPDITLGGAGPSGEVPR